MLPQLFIESDSLLLENKGNQTGGEKDIAENLLLIFFERKKLTEEAEGSFLALKYRFSLPSLPRKKYRKDWKWNLIL